MKLVRILTLIFIARAAVAAPEAAIKDLKHALSFLDQNKTFWADFSQTKTIKGMGFELKSTGHLEVLPDQHAVWQIETPSYLRVELQPGQVKLINDREGKNAQVFKDESKGGQTPGADHAWMDLLAFDEQKVAEKFSVVETDPHTFALTPRNAKAPFHKIICSTSKRGFFQKIRIEENADDAIEIQFAPPVVGLFAPKKARAK